METKTTRKCDACGKPLPPPAAAADGSPARHGPPRRYCRPACPPYLQQQQDKRRAAYLKRTQTEAGGAPRMCLHCNRVIPMRVHGNTRYCTPECRALHNDRIPSQPRPCGQCGAIIPARTTPGRQAQYCTRKCFLKHKYAEMLKDPVQHAKKKKSMRETYARRVSTPEGREKWNSYYRRYWRENPEQKEKHNARARARYLEDHPPKKKTPKGAS